MQRLNDGRPYGRSYWVIPNLFLAGYYPGEKDDEAALVKLETLLSTGVRTIINLMEEDEISWDGLPFTPYSHLLQRVAKSKDLDITYAQLSIEDMNVPSRASMQIVLDIIDSSLRKQRPVYIHCRGGIGRTGTVVGCFLARHAIASGDGIIIKLKELRLCDDAKSKEAPQTDVQRQMILSWNVGE